MFNRNRNRLKAFEKIAETWVTDLKNYTEDQLYIKPSEDHWNLAELYDHIMRVARTYQMPNFQKCLDNTGSEGPAKNIKAYLIFDLNFLPRRKIRIASFPKEIILNFTPEKRAKQELIEDFNTFIAETRQYASFLDNYNSKAKNFHPFFGMIDAKDWFSLVEIHMRHHQPQKKRLESLFQ
ncbi:hypothetical protein GTQ40_00860 [Flavobacteriaceae bacterium R38]|nr:hypothetical protein [Flavobacteriaceae bacterium R38]